MAPTRAVLAAALATIALAIPVGCIPQSYSDVGVAPVDYPPAMTTYRPASYNCDAAACTGAGNCGCASASAPGGLAVSDTPQFVVLTLDGGLTAAGWSTIGSVFETSPPVSANGCPLRATLFASSDWTDFDRVKHWHDLGHEVACNTMTLTPGYGTEESTWAHELRGCRLALATLAGIPQTEIVGARAPGLKYNRALFAALKAEGWLYDSSIPEAGFWGDGSASWGSLLSEGPGKKIWPYTLDHGLGQLCSQTSGGDTCDDPAWQVAGLWEVPVWTADAKDGTTKGTMDVTDLQTLKDNFDMRYDGSRSPMGVYVHPGRANAQVLRDFLAYAAAKDDVYFVTTRQLLEWSKNPMSASAMKTGFACPGDDSATRCSSAQTCSVGGHTFSMCTAAGACPALMPQPWDYKTALCGRAEQQCGASDEASPPAANFECACSGWSVGDAGGSDDQPAACAACGAGSSGPCQKDDSAGTCLPFQNYPYGMCPPGANMCSNVAVDCMVSPWTGWSECQVGGSPCSGSGQTGTRSRSRRQLVAPLNGGDTCPSLTEEAACDCNEPVDCILSQWTQWGNCETYSQKQSRSRYVVRQPANGGAACGSTYEQQDCTAEKEDTGYQDCTGCYTGTSGPCKGDESPFICYQFQAGVSPPTCPVGASTCGPPPDACYFTPCKNGATCTLVGDDGYSCTCASGFTGATCAANIDDCAGHGCQNGATCVDGVNGYACTCAAGYTGAMCQTEVDECAANPCLNGASCTDGIGSYTCDCAPGFTGTNCETNIDDCASNPCANGATCVDGVAGHSCACVAGYTGVDCGTEIDECASGPCLNGATCTDHVNAYSCGCAPGYSGPTCATNIDDCEGGPCQHGGTCVDGVNAFTCACATGYTGATCAVDIDHCASSPCLNGGTCTDGLDTYSCTCVPGYTGSTCGVNVDDCEGAPCLHGGTCSDGVDSFTCACAPGFTGPTCSVNIDDCASGPCLNSATCVDGIASFSCICEAGYTGPTCATDIDECAASPCKNGGTCTDQVDGFQCACPPGLSGYDCDGSVDDCAPHPCQNGGTCSDGHNSYTCTCKAGFTGTNCETEVDECATSPCLHGGACSDLLNAFRCTCANGFTGATCAVNVDDCAASPCAHGGTCLDGVDSFSCVCAAGFTGSTCTVNVDDCAASPCHNGGTCMDGVDSFSCDCDAGYTGATCTIDVDDCVNSPCLNGGSCVDGLDSFTCLCPQGYTGAVCGTDIDDCSASSCANGGTCVDGVDAFTCACPAGFTGARCETELFCAASPCLHGGLCTEGVRSYQCACPAGFTGVNCEVDVCASVACANGGSCVGGVGSYSCMCPSGFTGSTCATNIDDCGTNPCANGATCVDGIDGFTCVCASGFTGATCDTNVDDCAATPCLNGATCVDGVDAYACTCVAGYTGWTCATNVNDCAGIVCQHGGTCVDGVGSYTCSCVPGFTGAACETALSPSSGDGGSSASSSTGSSTGSTSASGSHASSGSSSGSSSSVSSGSSTGSGSSGGANSASGSSSSSTGGGGTGSGGTGSGGTDFMDTCAPSHCWPGTAGDCAGIDGVCFPRLAGHSSIICPANTTACDGSAGSPARSSWDGTGACATCWGDSAGPCQATSTLCYNYIDSVRRICPAGTQACVTGGSLPRATAVTATVRLTRVSVANATTPAARRVLRIAIAKISGVTPSHVVIVSVMGGGSGSSRARTLLAAQVIVNFRVVVPDIADAQALFTAGSVATDASAVSSALVAAVSSGQLVKELAAAAALEQAGDASASAFRELTPSDATLEGDVTVQLGDSAGDSGGGAGGAGQQALDVGLGTGPSSEGSNTMVIAAGALGVIVALGLFVLAVGRYRRHRDDAQRHNEIKVTSKVTVQPRSAAGSQQHEQLELEGVSDSSDDDDREAGSIAVSKSVDGSPDGSAGGSQRALLARDGSKSKIRRGGGDKRRKVQPLKVAAPLPLSTATSAVELPPVQPPRHNSGRGVYAAVGAADDKEGAFDSRLLYSREDGTAVASFTDVPLPSGPLPAGASFSTLFAGDSVGPPERRVPEPTMMADGRRAGSEQSLTSMSVVSPSHSATARSGSLLSARMPSARTRNMRNPTTVQVTARVAERPACVPPLDFGKLRAFEAAQAAKAQVPPSPKLKPKDASTHE